ncbi:MAG: radical SAM protein [candidate division WOR-3 bacterium]|nr:MAG: radical SAM protein [candidate division WOR-3 bacterium]
MNRETKYTYGPVPSRRLGFSLGVDIIPFKTCTFDCIYCQLGKTTNKTARRAEYTPAQDIVDEIRRVLTKHKHIDYLTFSGSGEPTLHSRLGYIISSIKKFSDIPVAVLTNGSLLTMADVREDLSHADVVAPTLCGTASDIVQRINQPVSRITSDTILQGLMDFRNGYTGDIWLEVMLIQDLNDTDEHIKRLAARIKKISPEKIHLNTVVRPPSDKNIRAVPLEKLRVIQNLLGERCEIIAGFDKKMSPTDLKNRRDDIMNVIKRRPVTLDDIVRVTGVHIQEAQKILDSLISNNMIRFSEHNGHRYYEAMNRHATPG